MEEGVTQGPDEKAVTGHVGQGTLKIHENEESITTFTVRVNENTARERRGKMEDKKNNR